jgi:hypothetical protein
MIEHQHADPIGRDFRPPERTERPSAADVGPQVLALRKKRSKRGSGGLVAERQTTGHEVEGATDPTLPVQTRSGHELPRPDPREGESADDPSSRKAVTRLGRALARSAYAAGGRTGSRSSAMISRSRPSFGDEQVSNGRPVETRIHARAGM